MRTTKTVVYSIAVLLVLLFSGLYGVSPTKLSSAASGSCTTANTFRLTFFPAPTSFNFLGAFSTSNVRLQQMMWFPIVPIALPNGQPDQNVSVTDWVKSNSNYTNWEFNVKPGLMWSNGLPVNATDILTTFGPSFGLNASYDVLNLHQEIVRSYAMNSSTAVYVLNQSNPYLPTDFDITLGVMYPASMIQKDGVNSNFFNNIVADGPWYAQGYTQGSTQMVMVQNPYFKPTPAICQIDVGFVETEGLDGAQVQSGSTDLAEVDYVSASTLQTLPNIHILDEKAAAIQSIQYNVTLYPFNMTSFRQAIVYGINDSAIIQSAFNGYALSGYSSEGTIPQTLGLYYNPNQAKYSYDPNKAVSLLNSIGITGGNGAPLKYPNGTQVTLTFYTDTSKSYDVTSASVIVANLQKLGFTVNLKTESRSALAGLPNVPAAEMLLWSSGGVNFPNPIYDAIPGWEVYSAVTIPQQYWQWPPSIDAQYKSNLTSLEATADPTQVTQYLDNIQSINAQNLPAITVTYPDDDWAYSTANWVNWTPYPPGFVTLNSKLNSFELVTLLPASQSTATSSATGLGSSSSQTQVTTSSSALVTTSSSGSSIAINASYWLVLAAAAIIIVALSFGYLFAERRPDHP